MPVEFVTHADLIARQSKISYFGCVSILYLVLELQRQLFL